jgi:GNAT superfamily N-acetyltransferase
MMNVAMHDQSETLRNGTKVRVRCIRPDDKDRVSEAFKDLDPESIYLRFFQEKSSLTDADLKWATEVDFDDIVALVVTVGEGESEAIIGAGRYLCLGGTEEQATAEVAFTVVEGFRRQGIAGLLLRQLAEIARGKGICRFSAWVLARNKGMLTVFTKSGFSVTTRCEGDTRHVTLALP